MYHIYIYIYIYMCVRVFSFSNSTSCSDMRRFGPISDGRTLSFNAGSEVRQECRELANQAPHAAQGQGRN